MKPKIGLLVTDLDNTLYDWVTFFASAFRAMVRVAGEILSVPEETVLDELQAVHQLHGNSEQPFALLDISSVLKRYGTASRQERAQALDRALHAFNSARNRELGLYPNVKETLQVIVRTSVIVAHTEASSANAVFRLRKLGIAHLIDQLYAIDDVGPGHPYPERVLEYAAAAEKVRRLSPGERKPNPEVLLTICRDYNVAVDETLYVGDSISRDIGMARAAGVWSAWAKYGTTYDPASWQTLVRVTHWRAEDVARAQKAEQMYGSSKPNVVLNQGFDELLEHFSFVGRGTER